MIKLINRKDYTERIAPFINKNIIKVFTGNVVSEKAAFCGKLKNTLKALFPIPTP